ncbi:head decoration protein [Aliiroseovarius lamellibrachiae]|uniref:head decoration protein n=1 Tax=Aliiroseovarius lamellibrachiae TaxID=1924933 RepID=UPI001BE01435|nr:head decoration protein [Aliiroseovarius lamellibrachiae]MBT2130115.1 head decoration protein [Aliiroseovarius lamellibrachiae]
MDNATMQTRNLAFLLSEGSGRISRATATIPAGTGKVAAGTVIGQLTAAAGNFVPSPNAETVGLEGAEVATAILAYSVDATAADVEVTIIDRDAEAKLPMLTFDTSVDDPTKTTAKIAQLNAVGIRAR